jgi:hypothetical protein
VSRRKRVERAVEAIGDQIADFFTVKPRARAPRTLLPQNPLAVQLQKAAQQTRRALPAPPKPLALPAPGPGLPPQASKPRGGQFWADREFDGSNVSPEAVARQQANDLSYNFIDFVPEEEGVVRMGTPQDTTVQDWLARSLAKYYKTDFGAPDDPLRDLAARGLHYDVDMTPERWKATVDSYLMEDPIEQVLFPPNPMGGMPGAGSDMRGGALAAMPWLAKQPVTDKIYGISSGGLDIEHFADELRNALNPEASGLPADLALRPESLARMSFPQAAERVGRINQFRVKQMEEAAQALADNPAIQTFKEYPDAGYRWVELRKPEARSDVLPDGYTMRETSDETPGFGPRTIYEVVDPRGSVLADYLDPEEAIRMTWDDVSHKPLRDALKYEGDTMGHCVGGYCDDVAGGRSRIFSLRDAKGQPHVTVETSPGKAKAVLPSGREVDKQFLLSAGLSPRVADDVMYAVDRDKSIVQHLTQARGHVGYGSAPYNEYSAAIPFVAGLDYARVAGPEDIIQIKGKQNRAPVDDYLPFVQDFVKGGTWGNVGDLRNTGLVKLPDGRFITQQQAEEAIGAIPETTTMRRAYGSNEMVPTREVYDPSSLDYMDPEEWAGISQYFEGFAIGGRVSSDRCFSRNPMSVR